MKNWYARLTAGTTPKYFANEAELQSYYEKTYQENIAGGYINAEETSLEDWRNLDDDMEYNDDYGAEE